LGSTLGDYLGSILAEGLRSGFTDSLGSTLGDCFGSTLGDGFLSGLGEGLVSILGETLRSGLGEVLGSTLPGTLLSCGLGDCFTLVGVLTSFWTGSFVSSLAASGFSFTMVSVASSTSIVCLPWVVAASDRISPLLFFFT
jgi:hypothetical protein